MKNIYLLVVLFIMASSTVHGMTQKEALKELGLSEGTVEELKKKLGPAYLKLVQEYHKNPKSPEAAKKIKRAGEAKKIIAQAIEKEEKKIAKFSKQNVQAQEEAIQKNKEKKRLEHERDKRLKEKGIKQIEKITSVQKITPSTVKQPSEQTKDILAHIKIINASGYPIKIRITYKNGEQKEIVVSKTFNLSWGIDEITSIVYWQDTWRKALLTSLLRSEYEIFGAKAKNEIMQACKKNPDKEFTYVITITSSNQFEPKLQPRI